MMYIKLFNIEFWKNYKIQLNIKDSKLINLKIINIWKIINLFNKWFINNKDYTLKIWITF